VQTRRAQGPSRLAVALVLPPASLLPGHALTGASTARGSRWTGRHRIGLDALEGAPLVENHNDTACLPGPPASAGTTDTFLVSRATCRRARVPMSTAIDRLNERRARVEERERRFGAVLESGSGPTQTFATSALMSAIWGKADSLCSTRGFPSLTHCGTHILRSARRVGQFLR